MACLFFLLSFVNTIVDGLKDSLVVTAAGGGPHVLPFVTVYGVLPSSFLFLVVYSWASSRLSRARMFEIVVSLFAALFVVFGLAYPHHELLHLDNLAVFLSSLLPVGAAGLVGMLRNWTFSLFFCVSELWGDVCLSLLFWGLANEITALEDAALLYPLLGVGANLAQATAGRLVHRGLRAAAARGVPYARQLQATLAACVACALGAVALHRWIAARHERQSRPDDVLAGKQAGAAPEVASSAAEGSTMSLRDAFDYLLRSPPVRCLAILALCQGMCSVLLDLAWKHHVHLLAPSPPEYAAFMGQTAMWTGIVTCAAMLVSPLMFELLGWLGVARATPSLMLWGGSPFFLGAAAFQLWLVCRSAGAGGLGSTPGWATGLVASARPLLALLSGPVERFAAATLASPLRLLVLAGAALQVASKGAKFSLYKPAEEMVYIGLDAESRSKGKAAIDVVGAQSGKAIGSLFQQGLLLVLGGRMGAVFPILGGVFVTLARMWLRTVDQLGTIRRGLGAEGQARGSHVAVVEGGGSETGGPAEGGGAVESSGGVPAETEKTLTRP